MRHKRSTSRECPILQDIDGLIATILAHNGLMPTEELVTAITDSVDSDDVKSCRVQLFGVARGLYHEMLSDGDLTQTVSFRLKSRRGVTARTACAKDHVRLFQYISGLVTCFPMDTITALCHPLLTRSQPTEALKGHRVVWKIEIYYLIRMTYEWKSMSSGWHNNIVVTHPDEIPISAKSSGWHMVVWYVIRMTYCSVQKSSGWDTARS